MLIDNVLSAVSPVSAMTANKPTILVIDDDSEIRYSLARVLSSRDYAVATVASGEEGLTAVRNGPPDVIFLDVRWAA